MTSVLYKLAEYIDINLDKNASKSNNILDLKSIYNFETLQTGILTQKIKHPIHKYPHRENIWFL